MWFLYSLVILLGSASTLHMPPHKRLEPGLQGDIPSHLAGSKGGHHFKAFPNRIGHSNSIFKRNVADIEDGRIDSIDMQLKIISDKLDHLLKEKHNKNEPVNKEAAENNEEVIHDVTGEQIEPKDIEENIDDHAANLYDDSNISIKNKSNEISYDSDVDPPTYKYKRHAKWNNKSHKTYFRKKYKSVDNLQRSVVKREVPITNVDVIDSGHHMLHEEIDRNIERLGTIHKDLSDRVHLGIANAVGRFPGISGGLRKKRHVQIPALPSENVVSKRASETKEILEPKFEVY